MFELEVEIADFFQEITVGVVYEFFDVFLEQAVDVLGRRRDVVADFYVFVFLAEAAGDVVADAGDEHVVEEKQEIEAEEDAPLFLTEIFHDAG